MTVDDYARAIIAEGQRRGISPRGIVIALSVPYVETEYVMYANAGDPASLALYHDAVGYDYDSAGLFQQRPPWGPIGCRMDPACSAGLFFDGGQSGQPGLCAFDYDNPANSPGFYAAEVQQPAAQYRGRYDDRMADAQALYDRLVTAMPVSTEVVLNYDRRVVPQQTGWDCGPAATQVVLNGAGVVVDEMVLVHEIGTNVGGTDDIAQVAAVLRFRLPAADYQTVYMPDDPPTDTQRAQLWQDITTSINAGYGLVMNWVAPPNNYPIGVNGSASPTYRGGTVFHYVAAMGYKAIEPRAVWIADSGFPPFGYWCSFDQVATLIPPKGYCYAKGAPMPPPENLTDRQVLNEIWDQLRIAWPQLGGKTLVDAVADIHQQLGKQ